jgi:hypothetical protein
MPHLNRSDYYAKEPGIWSGKGAERLRLSGEVTREDSLALASNKVPGTKEKLTVRTKDKRTAGYDFRAKRTRANAHELESPDARIATRSLGRGR